jgi:tribbles-like protein
MTSRVAYKRQFVVDLGRAADQLNHAKRQKIALSSTTSSTSASATAAPLSPPAAPTSTIGQASEKKSEIVGRLIGPYRLLGALEENNGTNGPNNANVNGNVPSLPIAAYTAVDTRSNRLVICRRLDRSKYEHLLGLCDRLGSCDEVNVRDEEANRASYRRVIPEESELIRDEDGDGQYYFVEPKSYGSLHAYVIERKRLSESECLWFFRQILSLLVFCHRRGVVLRDLKLRKFVFVDPERRTIRLDGIDELFICPDRKMRDNEDDDDVQEEDNDKITDRHGCPAYVGPEILDLNQRSYSGRSADVWSLGVLVFVMLYGRYPFYDTTPQRLFHKIRQAQIHLSDEANVSFEARSMIRCLLRREPSERPSAMEITAHPWLQSEDRIKYSSSSTSARRPCILAQHQQLVQTSSGVRLMIVTNNNNNDVDQCVPSIDVDKQQNEAASKLAKITRDLAQIRRTVVNAVPSR